MQEYATVFLGAGVGGALRHALNNVAGRLVGEGLPISTAFINITGSLLMGYLVGWYGLRGAESPLWKLFLTTGLLGGYTTFSAFSVEVVALHERGQSTLAALYAIGSLLLSVGAAILGIWLGRQGAALS